MLGAVVACFPWLRKTRASVVRSFDYDEQACGLRQITQDMYFPGDETWDIEQGDALDLDYLED